MGGCHASAQGGEPCPWIQVGSTATWVGRPAWAPADDVAAIAVGVVTVVSAGSTIVDARFLLGHLGGAMDVKQALPGSVDNGPDARMVKLSYHSDPVVALGH